MKTPVAYFATVLVTFLVITVACHGLTALRGGDPEWISGLFTCLCSWLLFCVAFHKGADYGRSGK